jgi:hypothetical protein
MQLLHLRRPLQAAASNCCRHPTAAPAVSSLSERFALLRLDVGHTSTGIGGQRWASVKSQGAYKLTSKKTIPKKLGAKRTGGMMHRGGCSPICRDLLLIQCPQTST